MIAVSSPVFSMLNFEMALGFVSQKFEAWEIVGESLHFLPEIRRDFRDIAPSFEMRFSAHAPLSDVNIASLNPRIREAAVKEVIDGLNAAAEMEFATYTVHPGFWSPAGVLDRDAVHRAVSASLGAIDKASHEVGMKVALENMPEGPYTMGKTPEDLFAMLEDTDLGVCFDVGHANTANSIEGFLEHSGRFINVHVHDNNGRSDEHLPVGNGTVDFKRVVEGLKGYAGNLVIEAKSMPEAELSKARLEALTTFSS